MRLIIGADVKWWLVALSTVVAMAAPAQAQTFPSKTIRIIVPYPAGGIIEADLRKWGQLIQAAGLKAE